MQPHHHIHISTPFLFVAGLIVVAIIGLVIWSRAARRKSDRQHEEAMAYLKLQTQRDQNRRQQWTPQRNYMPRPSHYTAPQRAPQPAPGTTYIDNRSSGSDSLLTGFIIGDLAGSGNRETIVEERGYSAPSTDSGSGWDSGSSDSSSSSSDSGGLDISW